MVWHTQTEKRKVPLLRLDSNQRTTNLHQLIDDLSFKGVVKVDRAGKSLKVCKNVKGCDWCKTNFWRKTNQCNSSLVDKFKLWNCQDLQSTNQFWSDLFLWTVKCVLNTWTLLIDTPWTQTILEANYFCCLFLPQIFIVSHLDGPLKSISYTWIIVDPQKY